jgi:hypothetical protein
MLSEIVNTFRELYATRIVADYGDDSILSKPEAQLLIKQAGQIVGQMKSLKLRRNKI